MPLAGTIRVAVAVCCCCGGGVQLAAQAPAVVDPREFGLEIPPGPVRDGNGESIATADDDGNPVVAKLLVDVGDHRIVILPDGRLATRRRQAATSTERKFEPISKDALAARLLESELSGFKTNQTRRYLYLYNTSEEFALATSRILETMFPGVANYAKAQKIEIAEPDVPLVVVMFRTEDEFQRYQRMPAGVVAYYNTLDNRVVMYEESRLRSVKPELAIQQSIATISHEGAHQILHNIGVQKRLSRWPTWLSEGLAEFFAPTTFGNRLRWKGAGQVNDMRMFELEMYLKSRESDQPDGQMIEQTVVAGRLTSTGYASAWSLTHYLPKSKRANFNDYVLVSSCISRSFPTPTRSPIGHTSWPPSPFPRDDARSETRTYSTLRRWPPSGFKRLWKPSTRNSVPPPLLKCGHFPTARSRLFTRGSGSASEVRSSASSRIEFKRNTRRSVSAAITPPPLLVSR
ncbi:MAG: DUF1570 domain-containing protein [Planctomycetia bacterium]|nr:DUF1570 domain-containing protein [Planctomycetia bacterium]